MVPFLLTNMTFCLQRPQSLQTDRITLGGQFFRCERSAAARQLSVATCHAISVLLFRIWKGQIFISENMSRFFNWWADLKWCFNQIVILYVSSPKRLTSHRPFVVTPAFAFSPSEFFCLIDPAKRAVEMHKMKIDGSKLNKSTHWCGWSGGRAWGGARKLSRGQGSTPRAVRLCGEYCSFPARGTLQDGSALTPPRRTRWKRSQLCPAILHSLEQYQRCDFAPIKATQETGWSQ